MNVEEADDSDVIQETEFEDDEDSVNYLEQHLLASNRQISQKENLKKIEELQKKVHREERAVAKSLETKEMVPLTLFLSTSLNVEMVYTILHGICKFTLLNFMRNEFSHDQMKQFKAMEYKVDRYGDTTITLREIKIKNIDSWNKMQSHDHLLSKNTNSARTDTSFVSGVSSSDLERS